MCYNDGMRSAEVDGILVAASELKEPLSTLRQLALSFDEMDLAGEKIRSEMVSVSEKAIRQVNDLMRLRRLEGGMFVMEPVAVRSVCDEVTGELMNIFGYDRRSLKVKYSKRAGLVVANRELLRSVLWNFLVDGMHYGGEGMQSKLLVGDYRDKVRVMIRDFGPSLPTEIWREMQKGFMEQPTSIAMRPGSSGLGLYIASKFSQYMGAKMGAVRHRDGTSFFIDLNKSKQASLF